MKNLTNRTINKLIMGLSCLGVLSAVRCDSEHTGKIITPTLEKVNFAATTGSGGGLQFQEYDKVTLNIVDKDGKEANYYTDNDRKDGGTGTAFTDDGATLTLNDDGSVKGGFYLIGSSNPGTKYTIKKFDIDSGGDKTIDYELKEDVNFNLVKGTTLKKAVSVIEKKSGSVKGSPIPAIGTSVSFGISKLTVNQLTFTLKLKKSDDSYFNSTNDKSVVVNLDVKDGDNNVYQIADLFKAVSESDSEIFTITLPREDEYYSDDIAIKATAKNDRNAHNFEVESGTIKNGEVVLKVKNNHHALIVNKGANGTGNPSYKKGTVDNLGENDVFNVNNDNEILVFKAVRDSDDDISNIQCHWGLYKKGVNNPIIANDFGSTKSGVGTIDGKINPHTIKDGIGKDAALLSTKSKTEVENYYIKAKIIGDDGLGGIYTLKSLIFHLTKQ